jgi:hypothetical protein
MRITIKYEASWRNSFLGGSNNEPVSKNGREFLGSMTALGKKNTQGEYSNFIKRDITKDTVMGVLNRLIGDQRKLYQSKKSTDYFFADLEPHITFKDQQDRTKPINSEMVYIRNMTGKTDQNAFTGMIKDNHPVFNSDYSKDFWGILWLPLENLIRFFEDEQFDLNLEKSISINPISVLERSIYLKTKSKPISYDDFSFKTIEILAKKFPKEIYIESEKIKPIRLYAAALYIQLERLRQKFDMKEACNKRGSDIFIFGFSKRGFNGARDFMKNFTTGGEKPIWGNPYLLKEKRKGEGEVTSLLTKANGTLDIQLNIPDEKALQLKNMIENAGVSSFYIGKKGLAYVDSLRL